MPIRSHDDLYEIHMQAFEAQAKALVDLGSYYKEKSERLAAELETLREELALGNLK